MYITATDDFETITWPSPNDADATWAWDSAHCPRPISILANDGSERWTAAAFGAMNGHAINGYSYSNLGGGGLPQSETIPMAEVSRLWEDERLPVIKRDFFALKNHEYKGMTASQLAESLPDLFQRSANAFAVTMKTAFEMIPALTEYLTFCTMKWGVAGTVRGMRMIQGYANATTNSAKALSDIAEPARDSTALKAALAAGDIDVLRAAQGGSEIAAAFDAYLETDGWRLSSWMQLEQPTWAENPSTPLRLAAAFLDPNAVGPNEALAASAAEREDEITAAESELEEDDLAEFRRVREEADRYVTIIEDRAFWQMLLFGVLRIPTMVLGTKLADAGVLSAADDVYHLDVEELRRASSGTGEGWAAKAGGRRADLERWSKLIPPKHLGVQPTGRPKIPQVLMDGAGLQVEKDAKIVNGFGASPGVVQGTAKVVLDLEDLHRVESGDILVTVFTAPTWSPAFAIAGAVVTDAGGILSHAAIASREYALPAVVGTQIGTSKIPDGALVTVDGTQGVVRIED